MSSAILTDAEEGSSEVRAADSRSRANGSP